MAVTWTYLPPICEITSAYSFSAPTATTVPEVAFEVSPAELAEHAEQIRLPARAIPARAAARRAGMSFLLRTRASREKAIRAATVAYC
jgi:hypothetical protein